VVHRGQCSEQDVVGSTTGDSAMTLVKNRASDQDRNRDDVDGRRGAVPAAGWLPGQRNGSDRVVVLLICAGGESENLKAAWTEQAIDVHSCTDLGAALVLVGRDAPDLVVLGQSGRTAFGQLDFLLSLRQVDLATPVFVGCESPEVPDPAVLDAGATAAVRSPLSAAELLGIIESTVHHGKNFRARPLPIELGRLRVEGGSPRMWLDGVEVILPPLEFLLLRHLAERHGEFVGRDELVLAGWGDRVPCSSNSLSVHITRLRRKLADHFADDPIRSVRGYGYQLVVPSDPPRRGR